MKTADDHSKRITSSKPIPHIPLPFKEVMKDVLKVKPPEKGTRPRPKRNRRAQT